jgi:hypothetical protein
MERCFLHQQISFELPHQGTSESYDCLFGRRRSDNTHNTHA